MMESAILILLRLILAHLISDFLLQSNKLRDSKRGELKGQKTSKYVYQIAHSLIHAVVTYLIVAQWHYWVIPLIIFISHLVIDSIKCSCTENKLRSFIIDQGAHLLVIFTLWVIFFVSDDLKLHSELIQLLESKQVWITLIAYVLILKPTSVALGLFFKRWNIKHKNNGLKGAGEWIGYMERILILTLVITNHIGAVGFLLAAKSIFRFGELKDATDIQFTEYVLIGTLSSFTIAVILGLTVNLIC